MSKPVDLKTVKIFEPLKKKPSFENKIFNTLSADEVYDVLSSHSNETVTLWFKLQQACAIMLIIPLKIMIVT